MKRRLCNAYEHMTMPDRCADTIERKLQEKLEQQKEGRYVKTVSPVPARKNSWAAAVAAACLLLVLSVGGAMLYLGGMEYLPAQATQAATKFTLGDYSLVTDIPAEEVEAFAAEVRQNVIEGDWEAFSEKVQYPINILDKRIGAGGLLGLILRNKVNNTFISNIQSEGSNQLLCNWQGICMGDGNIWINDVEGELKITAINNMFADFVDAEDFVFVETEDGNVAILGYDGMAEEITLPTGYNQAPITQIGTGTPVIRNGDAVKILWIPESVTSIGKKAFANAPALKSVFFRGDAPPETEGVFEGSPNATVYYRPETSGWGDTWCGRPTMQYGEGHISLGVALVDIVPDIAYQALTEILDEDREFFSNEHQSMYTVTEYCERQTKVLGKEVTAPYFTLVDMDRDGVKELILQIRIEGDPLEDYLILRCTDSTDGKGFVYTYFEPQQKITDLKKDSSFYWRGSGTDQEAGFIMLGGSDSKTFMNSPSHADAAPVDWHAWPCVRSEAVVQSYEYTGTTRSHFPSMTYSVFEAILLGRADNDWTYWQEQMIQWGMICQEEGSDVFVYDPDAPGCRFFGTLDAENRLAFIGYYISNEYGEQEAKVRLGLSDAPLYIIGSYLEELDSHGIEVSRPEEVLDYLGAVPDDFRPADPQNYGRTVEHEVLRNVLDAFVDECTAKDRKEVEQYLAEDFSGTIPEALTGLDIHIISYDNFPEEQMAVGSRIEVSIAFAETRNPVDTYVLRFEVSKEKEGWKISSCDLVK